MAGVLGSFFKCKIRPYVDSDQEVWIRWYKAAPGAKVLPFYHRFSNDVWDDHFVDYLGPGQVSAERVWDKGLNYNGHPGLCHVGSLRQWQGGCYSWERLDVPPRPECCRPTRREACVCLRPTATIHTPGHIRSAGCACARTSGTVRASAAFMSYARACARPRATEAFAGRPGAVCGCGKGTVTVQPVYTAQGAVCGCGKGAQTPVHGFPIGVCACGKPAVTLNNSAFATQPVCGCGKGAVTVTARPWLTLGVCGCGKGGVSVTLPAGITVSCASAPVPQGLHLEVDSPNACSCLAGNWVLSYSSGTGNWLSPSVNLCAAGLAPWVLSCNPATSTWMFGRQNGTMYPATKLSDSPLSLQIVGVSGAPLCAGTYNAYVTA